MENIKFVSTGNEIKEMSRSKGRFIFLHIKDYLRFAWSF